jgi:hypothetical protein
MLRAGGRVAARPPNSFGSARDRSAGGAVRASSRPICAWVFASLVSGLARCASRVRSRGFGGRRVRGSAGSGCGFGGRRVRAVGSGVAGSGVGSGVASSGCGFGSWVRFAGSGRGLGPHRRWAMQSHRAPVGACRASTVGYPVPPCFGSGWACVDGGLLGPTARRPWGGWHMVMHRSTCLCAWLVPLGGFSGHRISRHHEILEPWSSIGRSRVPRSEAVRCIGCIEGRRRSYLHQMSRGHGRSCLAGVAAGAPVECE